MELNITKRQGVFFLASFISLLSVSVFLYLTGILLQPLVLILISIFVIAPFSRDFPFAKRLLVLISLLFIGWLLSDIGYALVPFGIAFLIAYLLDPFVSFLRKHNIPRWLTALLIDILLFGSIAAVAVFIFPIVFDQLDDAINKISDFIESTKKYLDSKAFYSFTKQFGMSHANTKYIVQIEILPRIESFISNIFESLRHLLTNISAIANQIVNIILIPILLFYFIKDFRKILNKLKSILEDNNTKLLFDLKRIGKILRKYISWQITAAIIVASVCTFFFSLFDVPYPTVLGILCGILNPIPYLGIFASMLISALTVLVIGTPDVMFQLLIVVSVISATHFMNAYLLEPNIAGRMIGLHPVLLLASLFVFGGMFGFMGLLVAVPLTATLMMFFEDWAKKSKAKKKVVIEKEELKGF